MEKYLACLKQNDNCYSISSGEESNIIPTYYEKVWHCSAEHEKVVASASSALVTGTVRDGSDIYVGTTCYKVRCKEMSQSLRKAYYGPDL